MVEMGGIEPPSVPLVVRPVDNVSITPYFYAL